jgi:hypothetical protein
VLQIRALALVSRRRCGRWPASPPQAHRYALVDLANSVRPTSTF